MTKSHVAGGAADRRGAEPPTDALTLIPGGALAVVPRSTEESRHHEEVDVREGGQVDLWYAFVAGSDAWDDVDPPAAVTDEATRIIEVVGLVAAGSWPILWLTATGATFTSRDVILLTTLVASLLLLIRPIISTRIRVRGAAASAAARTVLGGVAVASFAGLAPDLALLGAWPFGVAAGADVARTSLALDLPLNPSAWVRKLLLSPAHGGVLVALAVGVWLLASRSGVERIGLLYGAFLLCVVAAWLTASAVLRIDLRRREAEEESERRVVEREHRRRGHWLHDDVCGDLRSVRLRIERDAGTSGDVAAMLDDLEHRLRLRQLDEFIDAGSVRLAEVVQPYIRRAQQQGVQIVESPTVETAGQMVSGAIARSVQRSLGVLVPNAVHAGATTLAVRLVVSTDVVEVEVEDDAGGLDLSAVPAGQGLDRLRDELGRPNLVSERTASGSRLRATIPRSSPVRTDAAGGRSS